MQDQIKSLLDAIYKEYYVAELNVIQDREFPQPLSIKHGRKYIKVIQGDDVWGFIVNTDTDDKFRRGDILKPSNCNAPARNYEYGNILDGKYQVNWLGPYDRYSNSVCRI